jgi:TatD DNase family protein
MLGESDAPFLAPAPRRGNIYEPAFVVHTAARLAELRGRSASELARATTENFFRLFAKVPRSFMQGGQDEESGERGDKRESKGSGEAA